MPKNKSWFSIKALGKGDAEVSIYDEIGGWGLTAKEFKDDVKALGDVSNITVKINSPGGNVADGNAIFNILKKHSAHISVEIEGVALSMGSLIAMAGDTISIAENGMMMIHNPWGAAVGDAEELRKAAEVSDKFKAGLVRAYAARTGMSEDEISAMMDDETWLDAEEAVEFGFADEITDRVEMAAHFDLSRFQHVPEPLLSSGNKSDIIKRKNVMPDKKVDTNAGVSEPDIEELKAKAAEEALKAEEERQNAIRGSFKPYIEDHRDLLEACLKDRSVDVATANTKLLAALGEGRESLAGGSRITMGDPRERFREGALNALLMKAGVIEHDPKNEFRAYSLFEIAAHSLRMSGVSLAGKSRMDIVGAAFTHSTSDLPYLLENVIGKKLRAEYSAMQETWRNIADVSSVPDFKQNKRILLGSFSDLETISEGGEYTSGTLGEEYSTITAETKGRMISLTRQMIINDDLGGLMRNTSKLARAASRAVGNDVYNVINNNANMDDGNPIFGTAHNNLAGTGAAISVSTIGAGKKAMRTQMDPSGNDYLDIRAKTLLVPASLEDEALTFVASETDYSQANSKKPNIHRNTLDVVSEVRLDAASTTAWYLVADQMVAPLIEVAFLDGQETPYLEAENGFTIDGVRLKVRLDYGVAPIEYRGGYKNPGA